MKFKLVESIDDRLVEKAIEWTDEQIQDIKNRLEAGESISEVALDYKVSYGTLLSLADRYGMQRKTLLNKYYVYLKWINPDSPIPVPDGWKSLHKGITLNLLPSIQLGSYTLYQINAIKLALYRKIGINERRRSTINSIEILAFYINILQENSIDKLVQELQTIGNEKGEKAHASYQDLSTCPILSIEKSEIPKQGLVDFQDSAIAIEKWLTALGSVIGGWKDPETPAAKYIKEEALKHYHFDVNGDDYNATLYEYSFHEIVHSLFNKNGIKIPSSEYENMLANDIPYEIVYDISSIDDLQKCLKAYGDKRNILYGYIDTYGRVVYIGITQNPYLRARDYNKSNQDNRAIAKALSNGLINKLVIFKSYLPTFYSGSSSKLLRQLETEYSERIFKTYSPENKNKSFEELIKAGTLNIDKPGKNQSRNVIKSIQQYVSNLVTQEPLLASSEYREKLKSKFGDDIAEYLDQTSYSYLNFYLAAYILRHKETWKIDFLRNKVRTGRYKYLYPEIKSIDELEQLMDRAKISATAKRYNRNSWKAFHTINNQNSATELDDNINGDDYK